MNILPQAAPERAAALPPCAETDTPPGTCPNCGCSIAYVNLYVGGRGYKTYRLCQGDAGTGYLGCGFMCREGS